MRLEMKTSGLAIMLLLTALRCDTALAISPALLTPAQSTVVRVAGAPALSFAPNVAEKQLIELITTPGVIDHNAWVDFPRFKFGTASADLTPEGAVAVRHLAEILTTYPNISIKIGGYTDSSGHADRNTALSERRARAVMAALINAGVHSARLEAAGYGPAHPIATNDTEEGRAKNRRIAIRLTRK